MKSHGSWLLAALASILVARTAFAQGTEEKPGAPVVRTSATVQRNVRPNLATVTLQIAATGHSPSVAARLLAIRVDSLRRALSSIGVPHDSLVNASRWYWWPNRIETHFGPVRCVPRETPPPNVRGCDNKQDTTYTARERLTARIRDMARVGAVIDTALAYRVIDVSGPEFSATDVTITREDALREATSRARRQAEAMANAAGAQLGRLVSLSTYTSPDPSAYYRYYVSGLMEASSYSASAAPGTTIVAPSVPVSVTVYGQWELLTRP